MIFFHIRAYFSRGGLFGRVIDFRLHKDYRPRGPPPRVIGDVFWRLFCCLFVVLLVCFLCHFGGFWCCFGLFFGIFVVCTCGFFLSRCCLFWYFFVIFFPGLCAFFGVCCFCCVLCVFLIFSRQISQNCPVDARNERFRLRNARIRCQNRIFHCFWRSKKVPLFCFIFVSFLGLFLVFLWYLFWIFSRLRK